MSASNIQKNLNDLMKQLNRCDAECSYETNITIKEVRDLLDIMEAHKQYVVGLRFYSGTIMSRMEVSLSGIRNTNPDESFDITDYDSA